MNKVKILLITVLFIIFQHQISLAGDFSNIMDTFDYTDVLDADSAVEVQNVKGMEIFDENNTEVVETKNGFWSTIFNKDKSKKNTKSDKKNNSNDESFEPEIIDYDYDVDTEEIIPIYKKDEKDSEDSEDSEDSIDIKSDDNAIDAEVSNDDINKTEDKKKKDKKSKKKNSNETSSMEAFANTDVNIYCQDMEYFPERKEVVGNGDAKVVFVENGSIMIADKIVFNHDLNYIEGIDNVKMNRNGQVLEGDYVKVDLNYGNALMEKPFINEYDIKVNAKSGLITSDTLEAYDGIAYSDSDMEMRTYSAQHAAFFNMEINQNLYRKFYPKEYRDRGKGRKYHIKTKELYVKSTDGHDTIAFKNADVYYGKVLMMRGADISLATDKSQSFIETTVPEMGSMRYVGSFIGPSFVFNTPFSSTLKLSPILTHDDKLGVGLLARLRHKRNITQAIYSTAANELVLRGRQQLGDSDFFLEYGHMSYMNDWFLGSNISKYLAQLAYQKRFIYPELGMSISHRATAGYLTDLKNKMGTTRFRYQAMFTKNLAQYYNMDKKFTAGFDIISQGMMGVYGTGDSIGVLRVGPSVRTQYRGWGQRITYFQSAKGGGSPLKYTDDYRYGNASLQIIENLRLNKYVSLGLYAVLNLQDNDQTTKNMFSESRFMISLGPEDAKFSFGYDTVRQATMFNYTALIGIKDKDITFKKLFMKNPDKFAKTKDEKKRKFKLFEQKPSQSIEQSSNQFVDAADISVDNDMPDM